MTYHIMADLRDPLFPDSALLLAWYDQHRRDLPWRSAPGARADPYRVWLSEIMLQQTTTAAVAPYFQKFLNLWPNVCALAEAPVAEVMQAWAGLGYYSRARNLHACAKAIAERQGQFPRDEADLRALPGIGPYTAAAIAAIAFDRRAVVVDGNVERVVSRLFAIEAPLPVAKPEIRAAADSITPTTRCGDFAQAMMDLGATVCQPKRANCLLCPYQSACRAAQGGTALSFPRKAGKAARPQRAGAVFHIAREDGALLVRSRPPSGLLGGMSELPTTEWKANFDGDQAVNLAPLATVYRLHDEPVRHVFTHFGLDLQVFSAQVSVTTPAPIGFRWVAFEDIEREAWPSVMRKVLDKVKPK